MSLRVRNTRSFLSLAAVCLASACSGTETGPINNNMGDPSILVGGFQVNLIAPDVASSTPGYTAVIGKISDGPTPEGVIWTKASTVGACALSKPSVPFCNTPCGGSALCIAANTCKSYPAAKTVGTVRVTGVKTSTGGADFSMDPVANNYQPIGLTLPYPAFSAGDPIKFSATGGAYAPFALNTVGIPALSIVSNQLTIAPNQAARLSWTPPSQPLGSKIFVKLDISHHGGTKGMIECETDDSGTLDIAATLITDLVNLGTAGFPSIIVTRKAPVGSATIAIGRIDLVVASSIEQLVAVPGVVSCTDSTMCKNGTTCQADLTCK